MIMVPEYYECVLETGQHVLARACEPYTPAEIQRIVTHTYDGLRCEIVHMWSMHNRPDGMDIVML